MSSADRQSNTDSGFNEDGSGKMYGWGGDGLSEFILVSAGDVFLWNIMKFRILKFGIKSGNASRREPILVSHEF
jgi:hypothetical protein